MYYVWYSTTERKASHIEVFFHSGFYLIGKNSNTKIQHDARVSFEAEFETSCSKRKFKFNFHVILCSNRFYPFLVLLVLVLMTKLSMDQSIIDAGFRHVIKEIEAQECN